MYKIYSALIGILVAVMISINGVLSKGVGNDLSLIIIHLVGLIGIIIILFINKKVVNFRRDIPIYLYTAGFIGVFTVFFSNMSFNYIGASLTFSLGLLGQSILSIVIDHYGLLGAKVVKLNKKKFFGIITIALGIVIMAIF